MCKRLSIQADFRRLDLVSGWGSLREEACGLVLVELLGRAQALAEVSCLVDNSSIPDTSLPPTRRRPQMLLSLPVGLFRGPCRGASEALAQRWGQASLVLSMSRWMAVDHRTLQIRWLRPAAGQNLSGIAEIMC